MTKMPRAKIWFLTSLLPLAACGSIPTQEFEVRTINTEGQRVPCLVVVEGKWPMQGEQPLYTDCKVKIAFPRPEARLLVKPARVNAEGQIVNPPRELDPAPYLTESRDVMLGDPKIQLFILQVDRSFDG